jgi:hypothetical protein
VCGIHGYFSIHGAKIQVEMEYLLFYAELGKMIDLAGGVVIGQPSMSQQKKHRCFDIALRFKSGFLYRM